MNTTVEKNNPKIFPKNEGKINSKGMVAPLVPPRAPETKLSLQNELEKIVKLKKVALPVPPKSSQAKFAGIKAIFERNASHSQANDSNKTVSSNLGRTFGPIMQKLMKDNIHVSVSTSNKQRRDSGDSGISDVSSSTSDDEDRTIKDKMMENVKQANYQKSFDLHQVQATDELETVKFLKTLSKKERENLGFSPKQQNNQKVETSKKTYNPLDWNPIYQGKKRFSLDNMSSNSSSCSEKSNISDISDKSNNSNIVRCNITRSNSKEDLRKPDASHNDKSAGKKLSNVNVSELIRKFEQGNNIVKGR
ncbi:hypothetical protein [Wolbachia endosymbiont (group A) of Myopa testacea]|uniref:hypothetical protein n=1 Tax=Wolbachia endosymbiont (group A) of Myopa testacea TaxID=3066148 RepID=UPI00333FCBEE